MLAEKWPKIRGLREQSYISVARKTYETFFEGFFGSPIAFYVIVYVLNTEIMICAVGWLFLFYVLLMFVLMQYKEIHMFSDKKSNYIL